VQFPRVKPSEGRGPSQAGVYAELDDLIRLQFRAGGFSFLPRQPVRSLLAGRRASRLRGRGLDFEEIRNYLPGDDIRNMDWKVTARLGKPHTRVYTEEKDRPVLLVVDQRLGMFFGSRVSMKSVTAAQVAALGAWRALGVGDRVGAIVFNDREVIEISPLRSRQRVMQVLQAVVRMNHGLRVGGASPNPAMLNEVLQRALRLAKHDFLVAIVSDFSGADDKTRGMVTRLAAHNDVLAVFVYDPLEANLPAAGRLSVCQGDRHLEVDTGDARLRRRFSGQFEAALKTTRDLMLKRGIPVLPIHTAREVREQMQGVLGHALRPSSGTSIPWLR
jgi:uncharacterized protein (DUF58 family)